jgi:putative Holliday junction resolvase
VRALGLDFGHVRIGVALSDPTRTIAQPLEVIPHRGFTQVLARIQELITEHDVDRIVVGLPLRLDGREREEAAKVRAFVGKLQDAVPVVVELADERLSTAEAEKVMIEADVRRSRRRQARDAVAAALILQTYLDRRGAT